LLDLDLAEISFAQDVRELADQTGVEPAILCRKACRPWSSNSLLVSEGRGSLHGQAVTERAEAGDDAGGGQARPGSVPEFFAIPGLLRCTSTTGMVNTLSASWRATEVWV
jgi:hypothetical protein